MRYDRPRKFRHCKHRAFVMKMAVDKTWREIGSGEIDDLPGFVLAHADNAPILDRDS